MALEYDLVVEALPAYHVGPELGRGAWGVVLAGEHRTLRRPVAIKQLPKEIGEDAEVRARFLSEARTLASFDHPHIVHINDFVEYQGILLLIMDQLTGGTVGTRFRAQGYTPQAACALSLATCAGLHYAHERGVLHRDIKPENLMFSGEGVLKVVDFGIAKLVGGSSILATRAGTTLGTPAYIAPEQARGGQLSPATDVYATAMVLYELLTGSLAYPEVTDPVAALYQHIHEDPAPIRSINPGVPMELARVVDGALARDPAHRPQSADEFGRAVAQAATDAWGLGWSTATGIPLRGDGTMLLPSGERRHIEFADPTQGMAGPTVVRPATFPASAAQAAAVAQSNPPQAAPPQVSSWPPAGAPPGQASYPPGPPSYPPGQASYPSYPPAAPGYPPPQASYPPGQASYPPAGGSYPPQPSYPPGARPPLPPYVPKKRGKGRPAVLIILGVVAALVVVVVVGLIIAANSSSSYSSDSNSSIDSTGSSVDNSGSGSSDTTPDTTPPDTSASP